MYITNNFLDHAEQIFITNIVGSVYYLDADLFDEYLDLKPPSDINTSTPEQLMYYSLFVAAIMGEIYLKRK